MMTLRELLNSPNGEPAERAVVRALCENALREGHTREDIEAGKVVLCVGFGLAEGDSLTCFPLYWPEGYV